MKTGETTRKIDRYVQEFFNNGVVYIYSGRSNNENQHIILKQKFIARMSLEHPKAKYTHKFGFFDGLWCYKIEKHNL